MNLQLARQVRDNPHKLGHYLGYKDLNETHNLWIRNCWMNSKDYVLMAHRNSYKTSAVLIVGTIWYLIFNPEATILIVRKEYEGAASIVKAILKHYESQELHELYTSLGYADFRVKDAKKDSITLPYKKQVTKEGNIDSMGIGGAITGRHYDKILCDDICTLKDRVSKAERDTTKEFVRELMNIKKPGGTMTVTGTPWHKDDVYSILPEADRYPIGSVKINQFTDTVIEEIRQRTTASLFAINYQLKHVADENKVFTDFKWDNWRNELVGTVGHIDTAYSGDHYTAFTLKQERDGRIILKGWVWRKSITDLYHQIVEIANNHNCGTIYIEENADKGLSKLEMMKFYPTMIGYSEKENKHNKIIGYLKYNWPEIYFDQYCQEEYLNQILDYEEGEEPDDAPDSAASIIRLTKQGAAPLSFIGIYDLDKKQGEA